MKNYLPDSYKSPHTKALTSVCYAYLAINSALKILIQTRECNFENGHPANVRQRHGNIRAYSLDSRNIFLTLL
ncbi:MAG: hypothetical protein LBH25_04735 [Fibromonadaceae bacterium]|nr:hypothetical protein [Fibromonadaceae bacterium]